MRKLFNTLMILFLSSISFVSCMEESISFGKDKEDSSSSDVKEFVELNMRAILSRNLINVETDAQSRTTNVDISDYIVELYQTDDNEGKLIEKWTYSELPELVSVLSGDYYIMVKSHEEQPVDSKPYYEGRSDNFTVKPGAVTEISTITCRMRSIKAVVTIDQKLLVLLGTDIEIDLSLGEASAKITDITDIPINYFAPITDEGNVFTITFKGTVDGYYDEQILKENADAGTLMIIDFTLKNVSDEEIMEAGTAGLAIKVNQTVTNIDKEGNIVVKDEVIYEEPENPEGDDNIKPTIVGRGFDIDESQNVPKEGFECIVDITAANRFAHLYVTIDSETLTASVLESVGLVDHFDLAYPGDLAPVLGKDETGENGLGFPVGDQVIGQKNLVFDITPFTGLLNIYGAATHRFIIKVVDQSGVEVEKTLTLITE